MSQEKMVNTLQDYSKTSRSDMGPIGATHGLLHNFRNHPKLSGEGWYRGIGYSKSTLLSSSFGFSSFSQFLVLKITMMCNYEFYLLIVDFQFKYDIYVTSYNSSRFTIASLFSENEIRGLRFPLNSS